MERWAGKIAVVTGASSGIGLEISKTLMEHGMIVVGLARRKQKMEDEMQKVSATRGKFHGVECDVGKEEDVAKAFQWIKDNVGNVQVLINNAGTAVIGGYTVTAPSDWQKVINVNLMGSMYCAAAAIKMMQEEKSEGQIININSIEGHRIYLFNDTLFNAYGPSKFGITGFTETLQRELLGQNIRVTSLSPGLVQTEMVTEYPDISALEAHPMLRTKDIADAVVYIVGAPQRVQITELTIRPLGEKAL